MTPLALLSWTDWGALLEKSYCAPTDPEVLVYGLPAFPPDELQIATTGCAGEKTLATSLCFAQLVCEAIQATAGADFFVDAQLLDFGVGWGRITRSFLKEIKQAHIVGLDIDAMLIDVCDTTFHGGGQFLQCNAFPPTTLSAASLDVVVAYSVFSHLSEDAFNAWLDEFARITRPGGFVAISTRDKSFLDYCESLQQRPDLDWYAKILSTLFDSFDEQRRRYDAGEFVFSTRGYPASARDGASYGEAWVGPLFVKKAIEGRFTLVRHFTFEPEWVAPNMQPFYLLRRI